MKKRRAKMTRFGKTILSETQDHDEIASPAYITAEVFKQTCLRSNELVDRFLAIEPTDSINAGIKISRIADALYGQGDYQLPVYRMFLYDIYCRLYNLPGSAETGGVCFSGREQPKAN